MSGATKSPNELQNELEALRARVAELERAESERKQVEQALRESEKRYRKLFVPCHGFQAEILGAVLFGG